MTTDDFRIIRLDALRLATAVRQMALDLSTESPLAKETVWVARAVLMVQTVEDLLHYCTLLRVHFKRLTNLELNGHDDDALISPPLKLNGHDNPLKYFT